MGVRALMEAASDVQYRHLKSIRLWKVKAEDEGVRTTCLFIDKVKTLEVLDLLDNNIGHLSCTFLSKILHPAS